MSVNALAAGQSIEDAAADRHTSGFGDGTEGYSGRRRQPSASIRGHADVDQLTA
jgi:hypothetical protein